RNAMEAVYMAAEADADMIAAGSNTDTSAARTGVYADRVGQSRPGEGERCAKRRRPKCFS
ncbi:MAG TPA: hypothetical protein VLV55_09710, partial [Rhizomicrobium sp.]|nr:hypothetical protein [Rhizomicrobium sp.]